VSRRVVLNSEASAEVEEAAFWYESQRSGLGLAFLAAVDRTVEQIAAWPGAGTSVPGVSAELAVRQLPVLRFPYRVVYVVRSQAVWVLAVAHVRRRPGYWRSRTES